MHRDIMPLAMSWVIKTEGGYVNDPDDMGGETNYGITKRTYPEVDVKNLTIEQAMSIYRTDYWDANHCGELPPEFALFLFDSAVQHRPSTAVKLLQGAVGAAQDGVIGPNTIAITQQASGNEYMLTRAFAERARYYHRIVMSKPEQDKFIVGWLRRLFELHGFIHTAVLPEVSNG